MKQQICSIYDKRAEQYGPPMTFPTLGVAERSFQDAVNDAQSAINKHPEDYQMYKIGEYDSDTGAMTNLPPQLLCEATQLHGRL